MNISIVKNFFWKFFKRMANLNLSLFILLLIALFCCLGSVIEQDQTFRYYQLNYHSYGSVILLLGLDHTFRSWWFISVIFMFLISLIACTFSTQLPSLKNARRWKFIYKNNYLDADNYFTDDNFTVNYSFTNIIYSLMRSSFFVFCRCRSIYSYKGLYGRVAPIFVHFSIVAILFGSIYSFLFSSVLQEIIPSGETFHIKNILNAGFYSRLPSNLMIHIDDFYISYSSIGSIEQFFSKVFLYSDNKKIDSSITIFVNNPLNVRQFTIYQTDWLVNALRMKLGESYTIQKDLRKTNINGKVCWLSNLYLDNGKQIFFVIFDLNDTVLVCDNSGVILNEVSVGQKFYINSFPIILQEIIVSTGLQIKTDPGIIFVYLGFFIMILSTFTSYLSYSQVWVYSSVESLQFVGTTNRATVFFEQDMISISKVYYFYSKSIFIDLEKVKNVLR